jgi:Recombinase
VFMAKIFGFRTTGSNHQVEAAHTRALALVPTIRAGFVSRRALADMLNRRGIPTTHGGKWHYTTVVRMLTRLGRIAPGKGRIKNGLANRQAAADARAAAADARAKVLAPRIRAPAFLNRKTIERTL